MNIGNKYVKYQYKWQIQFWGNQKMLQYWYNCPSLVHARSVFYLIMLEPRNYLNLIAKVSRHLLLFLQIITNSESTYAELDSLMKLNADFV